MGLNYSNVHLLYVSIKFCPLLPTAFSAVVLGRVALLVLVSSFGVGLIVPNAFGSNSGHLMPLYLKK